jgi:hypothetical protein
VTDENARGRTQVERLRRELAGLPPPAMVRARELLERFLDSPSLTELAAELGVRPFPLLRSFRARS